MLLSPTGPEFDWTPSGFLRIYLEPGPGAMDRVAARVVLDERGDRHLVMLAPAPDGGWHLIYRLRMVEEVLASGGVSTGAFKESWSPRLSKTPEEET